MSLLDKVHSGVVPAPPRLVVYGTEGVGKSTFASQAEKPIFIPTEDGLAQINCDKFPVALQLEQVQEALRDLLNEKHCYKTVVIDSLDWLERLIWEHLCRKGGVDSIDSVGGGYGRGYTQAATCFREILGCLDMLRSDKGMTFIGVAHAKIEKFEDPETSSYDRHTPRLNKHVGALVNEWCDAVLFASVRYRTTTEDGGFNKKRTIATAVGQNGGERILRCVGSPACVAKNRFNLPPELPLSWPDLSHAMNPTRTPEKEKANG